MHGDELLDLLDELGIADNTIVMYSTDNGPPYNTWPDAGTILPQRKELELGRGLPGAGVRPPARPFSCGQDAQRHRHPRGLAADLRRLSRFLSRRMRSSGQNRQPNPTLLKKFADWSFRPQPSRTPTSRSEFTR